jgi:hypothetical protein
MCINLFFFKKAKNSIKVNYAQDVETHKIGPHVTMQEQPLQYTRSNGTTNFETPKNQHITTPIPQHRLRTVHTLYKQVRNVKENYHVIADKASLRQSTRIAKQWKRQVLMGTIKNAPAPQFAINA